MDSDDERVSKRQKTLTQLFEDDDDDDALPPRESIPNSCSEESDDEDEVVQPLPIPRAIGNGEKKMPSWASGSTSGRPAPAASAAALRPNPPIARNTPSVQVNTGYGGRKEYSVTSDDKPATFYCVQWWVPTGQA